MKRRIIFYILTLLWLIALVGCGKTAGEPTTVPDGEITAEATTENIVRAFSSAKLMSYSGAYAEDGTGEEVSGIAALTFVNDTGNFYQTLTLHVTDGENEYEFFITSLKPGALITVLDRAKTPYAGEEKSVAVTVAESSFFADIPEMHIDTFSLQVLDGVINIKNISGKDIPGDVYIYYKNKNENGYFGGITYRINCGAIASGELVQRGSAHLSAGNSEILFIDYEE